MTDNILRTLSLWYQMLPGKALLQAEQHALSAWLPSLHGDHLVLLGGSADMQLVASSGIAHKVWCGSYASNCCFAPQVVCDSTALPLLENSVDVMVVSHVLESSPNPHDLLDDIYHALVPGGIAIFLCFNRFSLWGCKRYFLNKSGYPWNVRFLSAGQLTLMLERHCLSVEHLDYAYYGVSSSLEKVHQRWRLLPSILPVLFPNFGVSMLAVTQKVTEAKAGLQKSSVWSSKKTVAAPSLEATFQQHDLRNNSIEDR